MQKLGPEARSWIFIQLSNFPNHYLVLVITDERFKFALITTKIIPGSMYASQALEDIAWLDFDRIHDAANILTVNDKTTIEIKSNQENDRSSGHGNQRGFNLDTQGLRELYGYCR